MSKTNYGFGYGWTKAPLGIIAGGASYPRGGTRIPTRQAMAQGQRFVYTRTKKPQRKSKRNSIRKAILNGETCQHMSRDDTVVTAALLHNNFYSISPTQLVGQGTSNASRIGDTIHLLALKLKGIIATAPVSNAFQYRIIVGMSRIQTSNNTFASGVFTQADIFIGSTGSSSGYSLNGIVNPKLFTALYDEVIDVNSLVSTTVDFANVEFTIPIDQKFEFARENGTFGSKRNMFLIVIPAVNGGTSNTTSCGNFSAGIDLLFKNHN